MPLMGRGWKFSRRLRLLISAILIVTIYVIWKHWRRLDDDQTYQGSDRSHLEGDRHHDLAGSRAGKEAGNMKGARRSSKGADLSDMKTCDDLYLAVTPNRPSTLTLRHLIEDNYAPLKLSNQDMAKVNANAMQIFVLTELARQDMFEVVCEVGRDVGYTPPTWLTLAQNVVLYRFYASVTSDSYSDRLKKYYEDMYGVRAHLIKGALSETFHADFTKDQMKCDVVHIQAGLDYETARTALRVFRDAVWDRSFIIADAVANMETVGRAWSEVTRSKVIVVEQMCGSDFSMGIGHFNKRGQTSRKQPITNEKMTMT